ncbi:uncharacterized protein LOC132258075 [Phlebotomus argentipes]|uniref:uncharacterized protein LOC132258075 n=1 Tax=Phlebotomus argentipes TaxID=94469 RepID=UPI002892F60B|nr:uncharacterized protein LOC132258075 [Phlebotomus argentipes]
MTSHKCPEFVVDELLAIARKLGVQRPRLTFESGSNRGDGFIGVVTRVVIVDEESGAEIRLICKHLKRDPSDCEPFTTMDMFQREIFLYRRVLPEIVKLQHEKNVQQNEGFFTFPTCHFAEFNEKSQEAALVFDDLRFEGFEMLEKTKIPDADHVKMLMKQLGRLHAVSFALREQKPEILQSFECLEDLVTKLMAKKCMLSLPRKNCRLAQTLLRPEETHIMEHFRRWETSMWQEVAEAIASKNAEPYAVINHGDCWINNLMFNDSKICLLDWQTSRYGSPMLDLIYFFFTCTDKAFRDQHFRDCLDVYYDSLERLLEKLGGNAARQFPKAVMEDHLKRFAKLGMAMSTFTTPLDSGYVREHTEEPEHVLVEANKHQYETRMRGNIMDFFSSNFMH